jgi:pimeloyl-ACP methyl ester carboxylesterase
MSADELATIPMALPGERRALVLPGLGRLCWYQDGPSALARDARPLLLVHSVNAVASAYEVRPLYEHYRRQRPVYALDLPGFGSSERSPRDYTPRLMTDALLALIEEIARQHPGSAPDVVALSLSSEFAARAAVERPGSLRSLALVSPTGFRGRALRLGAPGTHLGSPRVLAFLLRRGRGRFLFRQLTRPGVIRYFLRRTWGARDIDDGLWRYDCEIAHVPGAEFAPLHFLTGFLFAADSGRLYQALTLPTWISHGVRGDFTDYRAVQQISGSPHVRVQVFATGALPHFEVPELFIKGYETFLGAL